MKKIRKWLSDRRDRRLREKLITHPTFTKAGTSGIDLGKSEDERIRKEIVGVIQKHYPNTPESYRWISWLEKQKELPFAKDVILGYPGIYFYDGERMHFRGSPAMEEKKKEPNYTKRNELFDKCVENCDPEVMKEVSDNVDKMLEPKIAFGDWGDKEKKGAIITCLKYMRFIKKITNQEYDDLMNWLDNNLVSNVLKKKQKEHQKKSDAQEKALGRDLTFPQDKDKNLDEIAQDYVERVKEYNPEPTWNLMQTAVCYGYHCCEQKEQKQVPISCSHENGTPAEWSEEDEEKLNNISEIIEHCTTIPYSGGTLTLNKEYKKELQCFIKSLRPSWKPSEEQMEALEFVIKDYREDSCNATANYLQEILDHLKNM